MRPLVSILIPAYNAEGWIGDTIKSAIGQTWPRKEIIVVDDGSTDQTLSVARQFASKEVSVTPQANQGAAATRNKAFSLCQGDYIQWLDADDLLAPDKIEKQMKAWTRVQPDERCFPRHGDGLFTGHGKPVLFQPHYGVICLRLNGCYGKWDKISSCKPERGLSVAN